MVNERKATVDDERGMVRGVNLGAPSTCPHREGHGHGSYSKAAVSFSNSACIRILHCPAADALREHASMTEDVMRSQQAQG